MSQDIAKLIQSGYQASREDRPEDARRDFKAALELSRDHGTRRELSHALKGLGQIERDRGDLRAALHLYQEAVAVCREDDDVLWLAHTVRHVGDIQQDMGRIEQAELCYDEALAIYRDHENAAPLDLANAVRPFALLKEILGAHQEAASLWREARDLYNELHIDVGVKECTAHLAKLGFEDQMR